MKFKGLLLKAIGLILISFILTRVDISKIISIMLLADFGLLSLAFLLVVGAFIIKIIRWNSLLTVIGSKFTLQKVSIMALGAYAIGLLTPAKAGDFLRAFWASKKSKKPIGQSIATVFLDRIFDLAALVLFGFLGVIAVFNSLSGNPLLLAIIAGSLLLIGIAILLSMQEFFVKFLVEKFIAVMVPKKFSEKTKGFLSDFYFAIKKCKKSYAYCALLTFASWILLLASDFLIARSIGVNVSPSFILIVMPLVFVVELIPISVAGIGTREATVAFLFSIAGFALEQALAFSFMLFIFNTIFTLAGLLAFTLQGE